MASSNHGECVSLLRRNELGSLPRRSANYGPWCKVWPWDDPFCCNGRYSGPGTRLKSAVVHQLCSVNVGCVASEVISPKY